MTYRPRTLADLERFHDLQVVPVVHVPGSSVVAMDEALLKRDFPFLGALGRADLERWIADNFSYVSAAQLKMGSLRNTPIPTDSAPVPAYRHRVQGRGDYMPVRDLEGRHAGLVDRKGTGIADERGVVKNRRLRRAFELAGALDRYEKRAHSNGLQLLDYALMEALYTRAAQLQFERHRAAIDPRLGAPQTIGVYFVLRFPFDVLRGPGASTPAALMARQAHVGRVWAGTNPVRELGADTNTVKQTDYFCSFVDLESTRMKDVRDLPPLFKRYDRMKSQDVAKEVETGALARGEILDALEEVGRKLAELRPAPPPEPDAAAAYQKVLDYILCSPSDYSCSAETILDFQRRHLVEFTRHPRTHAAIRALLALPESQAEKWAKDEPARRWGLSLIPSLPLPEALSAARRELAAGRPSLKYLARTFWMLPFDSARELLPALARREPAVLRASLRDRLREPSAAADPRRGDYLRWRDVLTPVRC